MNIQAMPSAGSYHSASAVSAGSAGTHSGSTSETTPASSESNPVRAGGAPPTPSANAPAATGMPQATPSSGTTDYSLNDALYDVRDLNKDGTISSYEEYIYSLTHFAESASQNQPTQYNAQGNLDTANDQTSNFINLFA